MTHIDKMLSQKRLNKLSEYILKKQKDAVLESDLSNRELTLCCRKSEILNLLKFLRDDKHCQFKVLVDLCGVDYPEREDRFCVVYHLLSMHLNQRIRVKIYVKDGDSAPSVVSLFSAANWYERETYDMYGIKFEKHPDLRRILTDYNFDGYPLRKDFPVQGKVEAYYDVNEQRVAYKPVDLPQETRSFNWESPWEAMTSNADLGGDSVFDEKEFNK